MSLCETFFSDVARGPKDPILGVAEACRADTTPNKINVGVGAYRDNNGKPVVLKSVQQAEETIYNQPHDHEYLPIEGNPEFVRLATELAYGADSEVLKSKRVAAIQSLSGTGALRLAAAFLSRFLPRDPEDKTPKVRVTDPTWGNHYQIFEHSGMSVAPFRYWDESTRGLHFTGMCEDLSNMTPHTVVILHACAHNPTGVDPTLEQWAKISQICKEKKLFVLFDSAYQGFASGNPETDIAAVRLFVNDGHHIILCQSFAKNFGLYGERIGNMSIICKDEEERTRVFSQLKICARAMYSNPPLYGAKIVQTILKSPELKTQWFKDIEEMASRIINMRALLKAELKKAGSTKNWDHITNQIGMFSYTGLNKAQSQRLTDDFHIYLTLNGRISMCGLTTDNVERFAQAVHEVSKDTQDANL